MDSGNCVYFDKDLTKEALSTHKNTAFQKVSSGRLYSIFLDVLAFNALQKFSGQHYLYFVFLFMFEQFYFFRSSKNVNIRSRNIANVYFSALFNELIIQRRNIPFPFF